MEGAKFARAVDCDGTSQWGAPAVGLTEVSAAPDVFRRIPPGGVSPTEAKAHFMLWRLRYRLREFATGSMWPIPVAIVVLATQLPAVIASFDRDLDDTALLDLSQGAATALLATIAGAMITFTGFVFAVLLLVVQFASGQLTPRVLRIAFRDRLTQVALGVFVGSFIYSLYVLEEVSEESVPELSLGVAVLLVLLSVVLFIALLSRVAGRLRAPQIADRVASDGLKSIRASCRRIQHAGTPRPTPPSPGGSPGQLVHPRRRGVVRAVDERALTRIAQRQRVEILMRRGIGDYISPAGPLFEVRGGKLSASRLRRAVIVREERATSYDPLFALRVLVDIANKALSPGINDPTTAVQVLDRIQALLEEFVRRELPSGTCLDDEGIVRFRRPVPTWDDILSLAVAEIRHYGTGSMQVTRRLRALLLDLLAESSPDRQEAIEDQLQQLERSVPEAFSESADRQLASAADWQGMGLSRVEATGVSGGKEPE